MKHIKDIEKPKKWNDEEGHFVIIDGDFFNSYLKHDQKIKEFTDNNIAQIKKMYYPGAWMRIEFDNCPKFVKEYFIRNEINIVHIKHMSKNKEDLEIILMAKKYNI